MFGLNKTYNINFITNCETQLESIQLKNKAIIPEFKAIEKDGYKFAGWFVDDKFEVAFNQEKMEKKDITLYAKWDRMTMEEFLNEVNFYTKSANILQTLQNDYSNVPQFKDEANKDTKSTKKKATKKKTTKAKKTTSNKQVEELEDEVIEEETVEEAEEETVLETNESTNEASVEEVESKEE